MQVRRARIKGGDSLQRFLKALQNNDKNGISIRDDTPLHDKATVTLYGVYRFDEPGALQKVLIEPSEGERTKDIAEVSDVLKNIEERRLYRVYVPDYERKGDLVKLWKDVNP